MKALIYLSISAICLFGSLLAEDIGLEWDLYPSPGGITHIDAECTQTATVDGSGVVTAIGPYTLMNSTPIPPTDTTFIAQVSTTGFWFCRVNAVSASGDSNTMKGIWKFITISSPGGTRTP